jgi:hypothetical protein
MNTRLVSILYIYPVHTYIIHIHVCRFVCTQVYSCTAAVCVYTNYSNLQSCTFTLFVLLQNVSHLY